jgi:soluble epoxide hydrolase / lipid-phosphate phosphatase
LNFYLSQLQNNDLEDNLSEYSSLAPQSLKSAHPYIHSEIPEKDWKIQKPSFFAVALRDCICTPLRGNASMKQFGTDVTTVDFDTGHWVHLEASDRFNEEFAAWLQQLTL